MHERYEKIMLKINEAKETGNSKQLKLWRNKLTKWQQQYGAYAPIGR